MLRGAALEFSGRLAASAGLAKTSDGSQSASFKFASGFMGASKLQASQRQAAHLRACKAIVKAR